VIFLTFVTEVLIYDKEITTPQKVGFFWPSNNQFAFFWPFVSVVWVFIEIFIWQPWLITVRK